MINISNANNRHANGTLDAGLGLAKTSLYERRSI